MAAAKRLAIVRGSCCCSGTSPQLSSISDQKENIAVAKCYHALQLAVQLASPFTRTEGLRPLKSTGSDGWLIQSFPMCYNPSSYRLFTRWIYDINNLGNVPSGTSGYSTSWRQTCRDLACTFISTVMITISYAFIKSNHKKKGQLHKAAMNTRRLFVRHFTDSFTTMDVLLQSPLLSSSASTWSHRTCKVFCH